MLGNLVRIVMLTFGIMILGPEVAIGRNPLQEPSWFHPLAGYLVFVVALGGMIVTALLLAAAHDGKLQARRSRRSEAENRGPIPIEGSELEGLSSDPRRDLY
jgi:hypothetical protein